MIRKEKMTPYLYLKYQHKCVGHEVRKVLQMVAGIIVPIDPSDVAMDASES